MIKQKNHSPDKDKLHAGKQQHTKEAIGEHSSIRNKKMVQKSERQKEKYKIMMMAILLAGACIIIYYFHVVLGTGTVFTHLFYIPIVLAAIWWKRKGLVVAVILMALLVSSHIFLRPDIATVNDYLRAFIFIVIAVLVAKLSERIAKEEELLRAEVTERVKAEEQVRQQNEFLNTILESLTYPFYVIDVNDYTIKLANSALCPGKLPEKTTCYMLNYKKDKPCNGSDTPCPLEEIKKTKRPVVIEHVHYDKDGNPRNAEVHAYPILDDKGNVSEIIEYSLDITERKQAEEKLKQTAEEWITTFDSITDMVSILDKDFKIVRANKAFASAFKMKPGEIIGKTCYELIHGTKEPPTFCPHKRTLDTGKPNRREYFDPHLGIHVEASTSPIFDENGQVIASVHIAKDITERKQAEETLKESEEKFRRLFEEITDAIFVGDAETGIIIDCNRAASELVGRERAELIGEHQRILHPPEEIEEGFSRTFKQHLKGKERQVLGDRVITKEGEIKDVAIRANHFELNGRKLVQAMFRDVTERKKAEKALRESEEKFRTFMETASDLMLITDKDENITYLNESMARTLGYSKEEMVGMNITQLLTKEALEKDFKPHWEEFVTNRKIILETTFATKDGKEVYGELKAVAIYESNGKRIGSRAIFRDTTERKQAEEEIRSLAKFPSEDPNPVLRIQKDGKILYGNDAALPLLALWKSKVGGVVPAKWRRLVDLTFESEKAISSEEEVDGSIFSFVIAPVTDNDYANIYVSDVTERKQAEAELKAAQEKLIDTAHRAGMAEVAADVLHNVGNVLNSINVSTTVIREKVISSELANLEKVAGIINEHTDDLGTFLTEDPQGKHIPVYLTEVSKCLTDEQTDIIDRLKVLTENVQHIKDIIGMQQSYAKVSGAEVQTSISKLAEDAIQINSAGLERHGTRLIREFEELGDVEIDKQKVLQILVNLVSNAKYALSDSNREEKLLTIRIYKHSEERFRIEVADNGVGISEDNLTKIFSYGFTTKKDGHGVGLHSSALAAKEMGGSLTVYSDGLGQGATFTLGLPFKPVEVMK